MVTDTARTGGVDPPRRSGSGSIPAAAPPPLRLTRRGVLTLGALGALAVAGGVAGGYALLGGEDPDDPVTMTPEVRDRPVPVPRTALQARTRVGTAAYVYEVSGARSRYYVTTAFGQRLDRWLALHAEQTGQRPDEVRSFGAWVPGVGRGWHGSGEAFDVASLSRGGRDLVSARYDRWRDDTAREVRTRLRRYWQLAAGLHTEFADVVTYLYDSSHTNHIHVDTGRFGPAGAPRLIRRSGVQVQAVQAMCRHVWGRADVQVNGEWDTATRDSTTGILEAHGGPAGGGDLTDGAEAWRTFMLATMRKE